MAQIGQIAVKGKQNISQREIKFLYVHQRIDDRQNVRHTAVALMHMRQEIGRQNREKQRHLHDKFIGNTVSLPGLSLIHI